MSKVYENGIIRDATQDEENTISQNGGGTSRFELIDNFTVSEDVRQKIFTFDNTYDELFIKCENIKGTDNGQLQANPKNTLNETKYFNIANILSTTTAKTFYIYFLRNTDNNYNIKYVRNVLTQATSEACFDFSSMTYDDKLLGVTVGTNTGNVMTSGTIKVYGRKLTNE